LGSLQEQVEREIDSLGASRSSRTNNVSGLAIQA
jgi:hypothetical protein